MNKFEQRARSAANLLFAVLRKMGCEDSDYGKAIVRIRVLCFRADFSDLNLKRENDCSLVTEAVFLALEAFMRLQGFMRTQENTMNPCYGENTWGHEHLLEMEQAAETAMALLA